MTYSDAEADAIFFGGLELAKSGLRRDAIKLWLPLANTGDVSTIENIICALALEDSIDEARSWLAKFANHEFDSLGELSKKIGVPLTEIYWMIAEDVETSIDVLEKLSNNANRNVRWAVATNSNAPISMAIAIAESAQQAEFSNLEKFFCDICQQHITEEQQGKWVEDLKRVCEYCLIPVGVRDARCTGCNRRVADQNSRLYVRTFFEKCYQSRIITKEQLTFFLEAFDRDGGRFVGKIVICEECDSPDIANDSQRFKTIRYSREDLEIPDFIGIFCANCDEEIGYDDCANCDEDLDEDDE
jgi:hypothetical protein